MLNEQRDEALGGWSDYVDPGQVPRLNDDQRLKDGAHMTFADAASPRHIHPNWRSDDQAAGVDHVPALMRSAAAIDADVEATPIIHWNGRRTRFDVGRRGKISFRSETRMTRG
ncbi:hypothetical protein [Bradyrhizobium sp. DASA03120]|uniref:hypothetical protein n=1 Tax=Bradyrhizobium sp. SMVTL-02 TaxID=3395917 RepID=UPI003F7201F8